MSGVDKATGRVVTLVVLLVVAVVALRGYVPGSERAPRAHTLGDTAAFIVIVALLGVSVTVVVIAVGARVRNRRAVMAPIAGRADWSRRGGVGRPKFRRPKWRRLLIGLGLIVACGLVFLSLAVLLTQLVGQLGIDQPSLQPPSSTPTAGSGTAPPGQHPASPAGGSLLGYLYATMALFLAVLAAGTIAVSRRGRNAAEPPAVSLEDREAVTPENRPESLARAAQLGLAEIGDPTREPREAIIACYAAMERELTSVPRAAPQDFDTASEVLTRAVDHAALRPDSAAQLVKLFTEARFSVHVMNEGHRDEAVRALRQVLAELRSAA